MAIEGENGVPQVPATVPAQGLTDFLAHQGRDAADQEQAAQQCPTPQQNSASGQSMHIKTSFHKRTTGPGRDEPGAEHQPGP